MTPSHRAKAATGEAADVPCDRAAPLDGQAPSDGQADQDGQDTQAQHEAALLAAYGAGDPVAAQRLAALLVPRVLAQAKRMLGDQAEAEDVAQEAMLRLWRAAAGWRPGEAKISTWLYRVAANLCTDRLRRRRSIDLETAFGPEGEVESGAISALTGMRQAERAAALRAALSDLPERQAQAVALRHFEGLSNPEIAAAMDIGVEAVESLTARGRRGLAARLLERRDGLGWDDGDGT